jgi:hypothetical protein
MSLTEVPLLFVLLGLTAYAVLGGATSEPACGSSSVPGGAGARCASTLTARWDPCGRPTTSG